MEPAKTTLLIIVLAMCTAELCALKEVQVVANSNEPKDRQERFLTDSTARPATHYKWSSWGSWSICHNDCSHPVEHSTRERHCYDGHREVPGYHCGSLSQERQTKSCPVICPQWSLWSAWSHCSATCGRGSIVRVRHCGTNDNTCVGQPLESRECIGQVCPVNGHWGTWHSWSSCSKTCGTGVQIRSRHCSSPSHNGHITCSGNTTSTKSCLISPCITDGGWSSWSVSRSCDTSCGNGSTVRTRTCTNPVPKNGGKPCTGSSIDVQACSLIQCPIDGGWSAYNSRSCSVTCGTGVTVKFRTCNNPAPAYGGADCVGKATEFSVCQKPDCVVDGGWSSWSNLTDCGVVCGDGHRWRTRTCTNPAPRHGGANCKGHDIESSDCNNGACPLDITICNEKDIQALVSANPFHANVIATAPVCTDPDMLQTELLVQKHCHVATSELDWELGVQVQDNCDFIPLYAPLGLIDIQTKHRKYGIMLDCFRDNMQIADLSCNSQLKVHNFLLNQTDSKYHMLML